LLGARTFHDTVRTEAELREIMGTPSELAVGKQLDRLDCHCRSFVALSPFVLVGTFDATGHATSPRAATPRGSWRCSTRRRW
jgi:predicted pyridoxine 5'-phosphate oxidase superfamily flavin-nucleotide-binding protein